MVCISLTAEADLAIRGDDIPNASRGGFLDVGGRHPSADRMNLVLGAMQASDCGQSWGDRGDAAVGDVKSWSTELVPTDERSRE